MLYCHAESNLQPTLMDQTHKVDG